MDYEELKRLSPSQRPRNTSNWDKSYFTDWRRVRWLVLASVPGVVSAAWNAAQSRSAIALSGLLISQAFLVIAYTTLCSGMSSSNWGTYFRSSEPVRYWTDVAILVGACALGIALIWLGN